MIELACLYNMNMTDGSQRYQSAENMFQSILRVQEQFLNGKVLIFKKRRRKNSRRLNGHRQVNLE